MTGRLIFLGEKSPLCLEHPRLIPSLPHEHDEYILLNKERDDRAMQNQGKQHLKTEHKIVS